MTAHVTLSVVEDALHEATSATGAGDASMHQLGEKFQAMMKNPRMEPPEASSTDQNMLAKAAGALDGSLRQSVADMASLTNAMPHMSMRELTAATTRAMFEMASTQVDLQVKMGVVKSSKGALETLMKNQ